MSGHYIINLSSQEFDKKVANFEKLDLEQRLRLLIDRHLLSRTPIVSTGSLMDLLPKFKDETSEPVFGIVAGIMNNLKIFAAPDTEYYPKLKQYIYNIVENNLNRLGIEPKKGEDTNDTKLRDLILGFALYAEDEKTIDALSALWKDDLSEIDAEIRGDVIAAKFRKDNEKDFDYLLDYYQKESNPTIKAEILSVISDARNPENIKKAMGLLKQPEIVRPQDHIYLVAYLLSNFWTRELTFDWVYENWDYIYTLTSDKTMDDYVRVAAARVRTMEQADRFFEFFDSKKDDKALKRSIEVAHVDIMARLRWIKDDSPSVHERLKNM